MSESPTPRLMSRREVAEYLGVSLEFVRDRLASGSLPHYKLGRSVRVAEADVVAYLAQARRVQTGGRS